jgi:hypothetical protein
MTFKYVIKTTFSEISVETNTVKEDFTAEIAEREGIWAGTTFYPVHMIEKIQMTILP